MTRTELRAACRALRVSRSGLAELLGIRRQSVSEWFNDKRPVPRPRQAQIEALLDGRGVRPPEISRTVDPRDISAPPARQRIAVERHDPPMPPASTDSLIGAINGALAMLLRPGAPQRPAEGRREPASPVTAPKVPGSAPASQRHPAGAAAGLARCQSPISGEPGVVSGPCQQFAAPGSRFCAMHALGQRG